VTLQNKEQMAWWRVIAVRALFVVALSAVVNFGLVLGALDMTKETEVKGGLLVADSAQAPVVQTAPSQVTLSLKYASVMDMQHLQHVDELMYTMASSGDEVAAKVVEVRKTTLIAKDEEDIPMTVFHTVVGNQLMVTPTQVLLIPGGDAATGKLAKMVLQGFTGDEILEALSMDEETAESLLDTMLLCNDEELRCNRFFVEDAGLDSTALEAKLAEHSARRLEDECPDTVDDEGGDRRLVGCLFNQCAFRIALTTSEFLGFAFHWPR